MNLKKDGYRRRKTEPGQVEWVTGIFCLLFLGVLLCAFLQMETFRSSAQYLEDALAASNLASAVIDVEEYGISHRVRIDDVREAYGKYRTAVKGNLNLNEAWECVNKGLIAGPVQVEEYTVYNVSGNDVEVSSFDGTGQLTQWKETLGSAVAPNGKMIETTGVYSEIRYRVEGLFGVSEEAHKGKLVDIAADSEP